MNAGRIIGETLKLHGTYPGRVQVMKIKVQTILSFKRILGAGEVEMDLPEGATIRELLARMVERLGDALSLHLFQPGTDELFPHIVLMVNGRLIHFLQDKETELHEGDVVLLFPPVAGG